jgi:PAS domain S-box-containing protein
MLDGLAYCRMIFDGEKHPVDFIFIEVNKNYEELTGMKGVVGKKITDLIPGIRASNPEMFDAYGRVSSTGRPEQIEIYVRPLSRWFLISVYSVKRGYFTSVFQNVTDRKQIEKDLENEKIAARNVSEDLQIEKEKIAEINAKDEAILASIGDGMIATDKDEVVIMMNHAAEVLLGWGSAEFLGKRLYKVLEAYDQQGGIVPFQEWSLHAALTPETSAATTDTTYFYAKKDGTKFPVAITVTPIILNNDIVGTIEIFRDITQEKEVDRQKSEFISIASHQLRTPLTGIQWVVERFTKKEKLTPKGKEYLNDIHMSAKRLTELVDRMLNLSRIEAGRIGVTPEPIEVVGLVASYLQEAAGLCEKKELKVVFKDHPADLDVRTDKSALRNIVQNLISNAIEYTPDKGKITVAIQKKKDVFVITVKDTGIGIPQSEQKQIFEKFVRAKNAKLYKTDGTGIGLYIAYRATSLLGGKIWFESEENKGSTFYVELPLIFELKQKQPLT